MSYLKNVGDAHAFIVPTRNMVRGANNNEEKEEEERAREEEWRIQKEEGRIKDLQQMSYALFHNGHLHATQLSDTLHVVHSVNVWKNLSRKEERKKMRQERYTKKKYSMYAHIVRVNSYVLY